jgi:hypothetical protein
MSLLPESQIPVPWRGSVQAVSRKARRCFENRVTQPETPDAHSWPSASLDLPNSMFDNDGPETKIEQYSQLYFTRFVPDGQFFIGQLSALPMNRRYYCILLS